MKKLFTIFLAILCAFAPITAFAADVAIAIDRKPLQTDTAPTSINGRTMVPVRAIFEGLGAEVTWNSDIKSITAQKDDKTIVLYLNDPTAFINGVSHTLDAPAISVNGRTMVPVRFIAESLGCQVYWDSYHKLVSIFTDAADAAAYAAELEQQQAERKAEEARIAAQKAEEERIAAQQKAQAETKQSYTVYVTPTGKRYHYSSSCNGGTYIASTLEKARARGLTPCKKCVG